MIRSNYDACIQCLKDVILIFYLYDMAAWVFVLTVSESGDIFLSHFTFTKD